MYDDLTTRQAAILDFIKSEIRVKGYPPAVREIGQAMGLNSPSTVHSHLMTLEQLGYIRRDQNKPRALEVLDGDISPALSLKEMVDIPILGTIHAGLPTFAEENFEDTFPLPLQYLYSNKRLFMLHVTGDSMVEAGIENGDLLIVEEATVAQNGEIVVALVEDEATVKTFFKEQDHIRLQPENSTMPPIFVKEAHIIGKPIGLFRRF